MAPTPSHLAGLPGEVGDAEAGSGRNTILRETHEAYISRHAHRQIRLRDGRIETG
jgi:hypothetical protein